MTKQVQASTVSASKSQANTAVIHTDVHDTLTNININMGKMASLLEQICSLQSDVRQPLQGERPTGTKRRPTAKRLQGLDSERESDSESESPETSTSQSKRKRQRREMAEDEISIFASDSADDQAELASLTNRGKKARKNTTDVEG